MNTLTYISHGTDALKDSTLTKYPQFQEDYNKRRVLGNIITHKLLELSEESNKLNLTGLEHSVKTASSIEGKIDRYGLDVKGLKDINRYTMLVDIKNFTKDVQNTIKNLKEEGYQIVACNNYFAKPYPNTDYRGLHYNIISNEGCMFELQFHTPESYQAKTEGHKIYEQVRDVNNKETYKNPDLEKEIRKIHNTPKQPKNIEKIHSFRLKDIEIDYSKAANVKISIEKEVSQKKNSEKSIYTVKISDIKVYEGIENKNKDTGEISGANTYYKATGEVESSEIYNILDNDITMYQAKDINDLPIQLKINKSEEKILTEGVKELILRAPYIFHDEDSCYLNVNQIAKNNGISTKIHTEKAVSLFNKARTELIKEGTIDESLSSKEKYLETKKEIKNTKDEVTK